MSIDGRRAFQLLEHLGAEADQLRGDMSVLRLQRDSARAESQHIIAAKNAEIDRLRLTDAEREAVEECYEWAMTADHRSLAATLRGLLERMGGNRDSERFTAE